jgi:hypothetical protein
LTELPIHSQTTCSPGCWQLPGGRQRHEGVQAMNDLSRRQFGVALAAVAVTLTGTGNGMRERPRSAQRLHAAREAKGLAVADCVEQSGLSEDQWLGLESGDEQGAIEMAYAADVLGVTVEWVAFGNTA